MKITPESLKVMTKKLAAENKILAAKASESKDEVENEELSSSVLDMFKDIEDAALDDEEELSLSPSASDNAEDDEDKVEDKTEDEVEDDGDESEDEPKDDLEDATIPDEDEVIDLGGDDDQSEFKSEKPKDEEDPEEDEEDEEDEEEPDSDEVDTDTEDDIELVDEPEDEQDDEPEDEPEDDLEDSPDYTDDDYDDVSVSISDDEEEEEEEDEEDEEYEEEELDESALGDAFSSIGKGLGGLLKTTLKGVAVLIAGLGGSFLFGLPGLLLAVCIAFGLASSKESSMDEEMENESEDECVHESLGAIKTKILAAIKTLKEIKKQNPEEMEKMDTIMRKGTPEQKKQIIAKVKSMGEKGASDSEAIVDADEGKTHKHDRRNGPHGRPHEKPKKMTQQDLLSDYDDEKEEYEVIPDPDDGVITEDDGINLSDLDSETIQELDNMDPDARDAILNANPETRDAILNNSNEETANLETPDAVVEFVTNSRYYNKSRTLRESVRRFRKIMKESKIRANYIYCKLNKICESTGIKERDFCKKFIKAVGKAN